jgi:hypothetical protein
MQPNPPCDQQLRERTIRLPASDCVVWLGRTNQGRYGLMTYQRRQYVAHRVAFELAYGPIPQTMYVCHSCDNPPCCNPEHLFLGTNQDNQIDSMRKGRYMTEKRVAGLVVTHDKKKGQPFPESGKEKQRRYVFTPEHRAKISAGVKRTRWPGDR